ncbi:MAG: hypothetical protein ABIJ34_06640 [archaeon]
MIAIFAKVKQHNRFKKLTAAVISRWVACKSIPIVASTPAQLFALTLSDDETFITENTVSAKHLYP